MPRATTGLAYLTISLVVLGSLVFTVFVTLPQWKSYRASREELARVIAEREERTRFLTSIDARVRELETYASDVLALSVAFPQKRLTPADLLANLQGIAGSSGAVVVDVGEPKQLAEAAAARASGPEEDVTRAAPGASPAPRAAASSLQRWETALKVRGTYAQLRVFIRELEKALLLSDVTALDVVAQGPTESPAVVTGTLEGKLTLRTYAQLVPQ